jgi:hypothetical protein
MLRHSALLFGLAALLGGSAAAAEADAPAIQRVISAQLDAFRHDDGNAAFAYAAPGIQARFIDGPHFLQMVRTAYPVVIGPRSVTFGELAVRAGEVVQTVELIGRNGAAAEALYEMEHEPDGSWKIAGCILTESGHLDI